MGTTNNVSVSAGQITPNVDAGGFIRLDFGDANDTAPGFAPGEYQTTLADNGPSHITGLPIFLGGGVDSEGDGAQSSNADGDNVAGNDDEDGIIDPMQLMIQEGQGVSSTSASPTIDIQLLLNRHPTDDAFFMPGLILTVTENLKL